MSDANRYVIETASPDETVRFGRSLGEQLRPGDVLALIGPLGAGKTQLVRGLARGLGAPGPVTSPTFKLVNEYAGRVRLYHVDAYRLSGPADLIALGCDEFFDGDGAAVVEWADRVAAALPEQRLQIDIDIVGPQSRRFDCIPAGPRPRQILETAL